MALRDFFRNLFSSSISNDRFERGSHGLPQVPDERIPPMPTVRAPGSADWTQREIDAARRADGREPLSPEAQAGVNREIEAARRADAPPVEKPTWKQASADALRGQRTSTGHDDFIINSRLLQDYPTPPTREDFSRTRGELSPEAQAQVTREIRAANGPVKDEIKRRSTLGEAIGAKAPAARPADTSHLMPPAPRPR